MARCEAGLLGVVLLVLAASGCQKDEPGLDGAVNLVDAAVEPDSGPLGAPCTKDADCASGLCLEGGICSGRCTGATDCPPGWRCEERAGVGKVCVCDGGGAEVCNGKDDDCDTKVDNGAPCPIGQYCHEGQCRCIPPSELCNGACEDVTQSLLHCGKCDNACPTSVAPPNMEPACLEGNCCSSCESKIKTTCFCC